MLKADVMPRKGSARLFTWVWDSPWLLLIFTGAVWGANGVAARLAIGQISPMSIVFFRWLLVCGTLLFALRGTVRDHLPALASYGPRIMALGFFGFTCFNTLYYLAAYRTTAVNMTLLQSVTPPLVLLGAALFLHARISLVQIVGMAVSFLGIGLVATRGDLARFADMSFNSGDIAILGACIFYAGYTLGLRKRPRVPALVYFAGVSFAACVTSLPLLAGEIALGKFYWPSLTGWLVLLFIAYGPSLIAQLTYMRAIELIGPARAGLFNNLVPVFGALFAVALLGEPFGLYHALALLLCVGGISLAESGKARERPAAKPSA